MKRCRGCGADKPLDEFHAHPRMGDGHLNYCKACVRARVSADREKKLGDPEWVKRERARSVAKQRRYNIQARMKWPEKISARKAVDNAVRRGRLVKPEICQRCERPTPRTRLQAHHADYSKPLDVTFVCAACHAAIEGRARQVV